LKCIQAHILALDEDDQPSFEITTEFKTPQVRCLICRTRGLRANYMRLHVIQLGHRLAKDRLLADKKRYKDVTLVRILEEVEKNSISKDVIAFRYEATYLCLLNAIPIKKLNIFRDFLEKYTRMKRLPNQHHLVSVYVKPIHNFKVKQVLACVTRPYGNQRLSTLCFDGTSKRGSEVMLLDSRTVDDDGYWHENVSLVYLF
jgi:hypothetical protein